MIVLLFVVLATVHAMDYGITAGTAPWPYHLGPHGSKHHFHTKLCREKGSRRAVYKSGFIYNLGHGHGGDCEELMLSPVRGSRGDVGFGVGLGFDERAARGEERRRNPDNLHLHKPYGFEIRHTVLHKVKDHVGDYERVVSYDSYMDKPLEVISSLPPAEKTSQAPKVIGTLILPGDDTKGVGSLESEGSHPHPLHIIETLGPNGEGEYYGE